MGLRRGELAGLEWKDINFQNKTMTIQRSVQDIVGFGLITKDPKTENSKRTISMPDKLIAYLKEYKVWWDNKKYYLGDRWKDTDRLFCTEMAQTSHQDYLEFGYKKHLQRQACQKCLFTLFVTPT